MSKIKDFVFYFLIVITYSVTLVEAMSMLIEGRWVDATISVTLGYMIKDHLFKMS